MVEFNIKKQCKECGLEYWEDGRVNNHSCVKTPTQSDEELMTDIIKKTKIDFIVTPSINNTGFIIPGTSKISNPQDLAQEILKHFERKDQDD